MDRFIHQESLKYFTQIPQFHSVVVITFALHAKGRRFEPGWNYFLKQKKKSPTLKNVVQRLQRYKR